MNIELGKLLGRGAGCGVYEYGPDKVCKLYIEKYGFDYANWEYKKTMDAYENGLPAPKVYEIIEYNGRFGLIMERFYGKTFNEMLNEAVLDNIRSGMENGRMDSKILCSSYELFLNQIKDTARILFQMHQKKVKLMQTAKSYLLNSCQNNPYLNQNEKNIICRITEGLPDSDCVCHGDPNPDNFMYNDGKILIIDWINSVNGSPLYDITEYKLLMEFSDEFDESEEISGFPDYFQRFYLKNRDELQRLFKDKNENIRIFTNEYVRLSNIDLSGMDHFYLPMLAAKMNGNNSENKQRRFLEGIKKELQLRNYG